MADSVLVVAAHPDDEVLGCGGTLARHVLAGDSVRVLIVAEGYLVGRRDRLRATMSSRWPYQHNGWINWSGKR